MFADYQQKHREEAQNRGKFGEERWEFHARWLLGGQLVDKGSSFF